MWKTPTIVPALDVDDVGKAAAWLEEAFGFKERRESRLTGADFVLTWLEIGEDGLLSLSQSSTPDPEPQGNEALKVYVADLDAHFERARRAGAEILEEPRDGFWGGRTYRARDPSGHRWEFSQAGVDRDSQDWDLPPGIKRGA